MSNCETCKAKQNPVSVPYVVHESAMARAERQIKSLVWVIVLLILLLVGSNVGWLVYENSFEDVVITQENDDGYNNFIGNNGDITN